MTRILVPTDFSEPSLVAVRHGIEQATTVGGVVLLLHVVEGPSVASYAVGGPQLSFRDVIDPGADYFRFPGGAKLIRRDFYEEAGWKLDALVPPGCQDCIRTVVTVGRVVDEIVRVAKDQHADLILLGAPGRRGWRRVFRRTMADRVRRKTLIPVVTLEADDLGVGRGPDRCGVPDQRIGGGRASSLSTELADVAKGVDASHGLPCVAATSQPGEAMHDRPEHPTPPQPARWDEPDGRHADTPSQAIGV